MILNLIALNINENDTVDLNTSYAYGYLRSLGEGVGYIIPVVLAAAGVLITLYFIIGAFKFIVSEGDKNSVSEAKKTITHTIIGAALLVLLFLITRFVPEFFKLQGMEILK